MSSNDGGSSGMSTEPFVWVLIPLVTIFSVGTFIAFLWNRRRRRSYRDRHVWPENRVLVGASYVRYRRGVRWSPWSETRPAEGLNELGEAPPPYDSKKPPGIGDHHGMQDESSASGTALRDVEAGQHPPEYPALPRPAHTVNTRS
ncbi:hypothetical protein QQS21_010875 [Conoideocrella luteorostrata]|uniref:Uncharacterized protein n=1 Tax=Conoideocrella luteorostrata TaxID=1105319 RepID=A0AAJ0FWE8_9HYPO|nr:hypothetical protein QQS21_010875 [Conoideocrella luteorostrata]